MCIFYIRDILLRSHNTVQFQTFVLTKNAAKNILSLYPGAPAYVYLLNIFQEVKLLNQIL